MIDETPQRRAISGCLIGGAVGDALGLPFEGISPRRQAKLASAGIDGHRFLFGRGMCSDDTEHACMTAQALIASGGDPDAFARTLAWRLRFWLLGLPAGIGSATLRSIVKLWLGIPPSRSGVFSAGNGPAMRAPILGVCCGGNMGLLKQWVVASTRLTHTDPKAERGALAIALAAYRSSVSLGAGQMRENFPEWLQEALASPDEDGLVASARKAVASARIGESTADFAKNQGLKGGVTGYIGHTVPVALQASFRHDNDYASAIRGVIQCGGDTDTTAAIVGGIVGAGVGPEGIPQAWIDGLWERPRSAKWIRALGERLDESRSAALPMSPLPLAVPLLIPRNALFLAAVLAHGFRRLLPPY